MGDLEKEISQEYELTVRNIIPFKDFFIIDSSAGKKVLRKLNFSSERIWFIHGAKEHLYKNNFCNLDRFTCTKEGLPYINIDGSIYTITETVQGRECDFDKKEDVIKASIALAEMHSASRGYIPPEQSIVKDELGNLPSHFIKRLEEIKRIKKTAQREKGCLDYLILQYIDYFYNLGESTINLIRESKYNMLVEKTRKERLFCHHDYTHSNIIIGSSETSIINFSLCSFELKVYDIANLLRRKMRKCFWDINEAKVIIDAYTSVEPISEDEFFIMKLMLQFPQKFWRVVNKYYNSRRSWRDKTFERKFIEVIDEIEYHKKFLDRYDLLY
ncbi:MAG: Spore coat protein I [Firmicutes bacterium ADurb.Bin419]|nr:MAG: Spore coat protein I [Firmicutes bacterium ADurb.Bin419]